jgi:MFS family permease
VTKYVIFGVTSLSFLLVAISGTTVTVAFPIITSEFHVSLIIASWVLGINQLMATVFMPLGGKAGEIWGVKRVYLVSIAIFTVGSLVCAIAPNIWILIFGRFLQSIGLGTILPLATAIVSDAFPGERQRAIGLITSILPIGTIIGPNIGGWMVGSFGWRSTFWLNIPLGIIVILVSLKLLKPMKGEGGQLDLIGTGFFTGSLSALLIALNTMGEIKSGASWFLPAALLVASAVFMLAFLRRENKIKNPVIDPTLLSKKPFLAANVFNFFYGSAALGVMSFMPLLATSVYGMTTLQSGVIMTPRSVGMVLGSITTSVYLPKWGYRGPMLAGTGIITLSLVLLGLEPLSINIAGIHLGGSFILGTILFLAGAGMGINAPAANNACIDLLPDRIGTITGLRGMFRQSGSAISIAVTSLALESFANMSRGFSVVCFGLAITLLMTVPVVFAMPKSPIDSYGVIKTGGQRS